MKKFSLLIVTLLFSSFAFGDKYVITFDSSRGSNYSPNDITLNIGDTIIWEGDFSSSPLTSLVVPDGAKMFNVNKGDEFMYMVTVPGEYDYECQEHFADGMTGKFVAADVNASAPVIKNVTPLYVVMEQGQNVIYSSYNGKKVSDFTLNIYDETGNLIIGTTINPYDSRYVIPQLPSGIYIVRVADNEKVVLATQIWEP